MVSFSEEEKKTLLNTLQTTTSYMKTDQIEKYKMENVRVKLNY